MRMKNGEKNNAGGLLLYEQAAGEIAGLIEQGTFRAGDRVPSIRQLSQRFNVSINTVMQAYTGGQAPYRGAAAIGLLCPQPGTRDTGTGSSVALFYRANNGHDQ